MFILDILDLAATPNKRARTIDRSLEKAQTEPYVFDYSPVGQLPFGYTTSSMAMNNISRSKQLDCSKIVRFYGQGSDDSYECIAPFLHVFRIQHAQ